MRGIAAASVWFEYDDAFGYGLDPIPVVATKYLNAEQFAYKIAGPSMDRERIFDGDYVVCIPYWVARSAPQTDDIVIVERRRGQTVERTCKQIVVNDGGYELWPRSTDPKYQSPIVIPDRRDPLCEDGLEIEIVGLVIGQFRPR